MKKAFLFLLVAGVVGLSACSKKTCPAYTGTQKPAAALDAERV